MSNSISLKDQIVSLKEFRLNAAKYIALLEKGQSFLVMKRSRPVFRLDPVDDVWETVGDFSAMSGGGVSANELIEALKSPR